MKSLMLLFSSILLFSSLSSEIIMDYAKIDEIREGDDFSMYAKVVKGDESISEIYLVTRSASGGDEKRFRMERDEGRAFIIIESDSLFRESFSYYFEIYLKNREFLVYPEDASKRQENTVAFKGFQNAEKRDVILFSPEDPDNVSELRPLIAIYSPMPYKERIILLDGANITKECRNSARVSSYTPLKNLSTGKHRIDVISEGILLKTFYINIGASSVISRIVSGEAAICGGISGDGSAGGVYGGLYADINADLGDPVLNLRISAPRIIEPANFRENRYSAALSSSVFNVSLGSFRFGSESSFIGRFFPAGASFSLSPGVFRLSGAYGVLQSVNADTKTEPYFSASAGAAFPLVSAMLGFYSLPASAADTGRTGIASAKGAAFLFDRKLTAEIEAALSSSPGDGAPSSFSADASAFSYRLKTSLLLGRIMAGIDYRRIARNFSYSDEYSLTVRGRTDAKSFVIIPLQSIRSCIDLFWTHSEYDSAVGEGMSFSKNVVSGAFSFRERGAPGIILFSDIIIDRISGRVRSFADYGLNISKQSEWRPGSIGFRAAISQMSSLGSDSLSLLLNLASDISLSAAANEHLIFEAGMKNERRVALSGDFRTLKLSAGAEMNFMEGKFKPKVSAGAFFPENSAEGGRLSLSCRLPVRIGRITILPAASLLSSFEMDMQYFSSDLSAAFSF